MFLFCTILNLLFSEMIISIQIDTSKSDLYYNASNIQIPKDIDNPFTPPIHIQKASYFFDSWEVESKYIDNINYEREVASIEKDIVKDERDTLLPNEKIILDGIKASDLPVASKAEVLLIQSGTDWDEHPIIKIEEELLPDSLELDTFDYALLATPNPAMEWTNISLNIPNIANTANLHIANIYHLNNTLQSIPLTTGENNLQLNVNTWQPSLYAVSVQVDGVIYDTKILVVIN